VTHTEQATTAEPAYLTVAEVAVLLRRSVYSVRRWISAGTLEATRLPSGQYLVGREAVEELLAPVAPDDDPAAVLAQLRATVEALDQRSGQAGE
jgi:excisionase family DNA binding protein